MTAVAIQGARERWIAAGMDDFLSKPVVTASVAGVLDRWLAETGADVTWEPELEAAPAEPEDEPIDRQALDSLRELDPGTLVNQLEQAFGRARIVLESIIAS